MASRKSALGRGLGALLPGDSDDAAKHAQQQEGPNSRLYRFDTQSRIVGRVADVEVNAIRANPFQPREQFDEKALNELAESIKELGIIQPITVRAHPEGHFEIISGERRLRAARRAGLDRIPAYLREADSEGMLEMALVENVQREQLNPMEVAIGYQRLMDECDLTQADVAKKVSKGRATVANFLRLLKLPPRVQAALRDEEITAGHARSLLSLNEAESQAELLDEIVKKDLSVRDVERRVRNWGKRRKKAASAPAKPDDRTALQLKNYTDQLRSAFSTQVKITRAADGSGVIEVAYYSDDDLERVIESLLPE